MVNEDWIESAAHACSEFGYRAWKRRKGDIIQFVAIRETTGKPYWDRTEKYTEESRMHQQVGQEIKTEANTAGVDLQWYSNVRERETVDGRIVTVWLWVGSTVTLTDEQLEELIANMSNGDQQALG